MNETHKKFLFGDVKVLIRGLRDIAEICGLQNEEDGKKLPSSVKGK